MKSRLLILIPALALTVAAAAPAAGQPIATFVRSWSMDYPWKVALGLGGTAWVGTADALEFYSTDRILRFRMQLGETGSPYVNGAFAILQNGDAVMADGTRLLRISPSGTLLKTWSLPWSLPTYLCSGLVADDAGIIYVLASENVASPTMTVIRFDVNSESVVGSWRLAYHADKIAYRAGVLFLLGPFDGRALPVEKRSTTGVVLGSFPAPFGYMATSIAVDAASRLIFSIETKNFVVVTDIDGAVIGYIGNPATSPIPEGRMGTPIDVSVNDDGILLVADHYNQRVLEYSLNQATPAHATSWGRLKALYR
jgi:hypothetical protein